MTIFVDVKPTETPVPLVAAVCAACGSPLRRATPTENTPSHECYGDFEWLSGLCKAS